MYLEIFSCLTSLYHFDVGSIGPIPFQSLPARLYLQILTGVLVPNMLNFFLQDKEFMFSISDLKFTQTFELQMTEMIHSQWRGKDRWFRLSIEMMD